MALAWLEQRTRELQVESREQKKAETLQKVFYRIAERAAAGLSFYDFLQSVHGLLGELLYARNCYVCLYNATRHTLDYPYYVDERDGDTMQGTDLPFRKGLTEYVLRTEQPQLIDAQRFLALQQSGEVTEATGDLSFSTWLGVPMPIRGVTGGVLVVQSYEEGIQYTASDADILSFVANHFSSAIERYQAIEALHQSEARYRTVIEQAGVGVVVVQDGRMVFGNPSLVRILGHSLEYLLSQPFTATVHPEDVDIMVRRHERRLRGEEVETHYGFRVITGKGELRWLELSAVKIEWEQRDATLLFVVDATSRVEAEMTQRTALQKQIELNDMKSRFISMASHEFRTPLAAIHGSVELLQNYEDRLSPRKKRLTLERIDDAAARMMHMLENVMMIGRTDAGQLQFRPRPLALTECCLALVDELCKAMPIPCSKVNLTLDLPDAASEFMLDEALIRNIVGNLVSNAIKYSPNGGEVRLGIAQHNDRLLLTVSDQGIGIPESDLDKLFENFHRASNVGFIAGTGLGLSIVKQAVNCHLGQISVQSQVGKGSCFTVELPTRLVIPPTLS